MSGAKKPEKDPLSSGPANAGQADGAPTQQQPMTGAEAEDAAKDIKGDAGMPLEEAQEQGYHGFTPDPTPNENYTVAGVVEGKPTPETNPKLAQVASARSTLPPQMGTMPGNQEQYEKVMEQKSKDLGVDTAPMKSDAPKSDASAGAAGENKPG